MFVTEKYTLYKTVDYLMKQNFQIIYIGNDHDEFILHKYEAKINHVIRIFRKTYDWANHLKRDVEQRLSLLLKQNRLFRGSETHFHFVFISDLTPVDDWEYLKRTAPIEHKKNCTVSLYYFDQDARNEEWLRLNKNINSNNDLPIFNELPMIEEQERQSVYLQQKIVNNQKIKEREFKDVFEFGKIRFTYLLIAINVLIFLLIEMNGDSTNVLQLIDWGAKYNPAIADGEWWRIVSSMFLHIGVFHLIMNMLALYFLGEVTERIYGSKRFLFIYFTAGIFGGIASYATNNAVAAGASGAIFGLFGALLFFGLHYRQLFFQTMGSNLLFVIGLNIVFGFTIPQIDNGAHIGGLIGGLIASQIIHLPKKNEKIKQLSATLVLVILLSGMTYYGTENAYTSVDPSTISLIAQRNIEEGKYDEVVHMLTLPIDAGVSHEYLYFHRSLAFIELGKTEEAESDLKQAIAINEDFAEAYYNLGVLAMRENDINAARNYVERAVELQPNNEFFEPLHNRLKQAE
ncbi:rhomboid family intramembrane serine protease [Bacillaceae bacterium W0354]